MPINFISTKRTLTDQATPIFPGVSGVGVVEASVKCRTNGLVFLSNIDESDGWRVLEGASFDLIIKGAYEETYNLNNLYWKNTVAGSNCEVEIFGQRRV